MVVEATYTRVFLLNSTTFKCCDSHTKFYFFVLMAKDILENYGNLSFLLLKSIMTNLIETIMTNNETMAA